MQDTHPIVWLEHHSLHYSRVLKSPLGGDRSPHPVTCSLSELCCLLVPSPKMGCFCFLKVYESRTYSMGKSSQYRNEYIRYKSPNTLVAFVNQGRLTRQLALMALWIVSGFTQSQTLLRRTALSQHPTRGVSSGRNVARPSHGLGSVVCSSAGPLCAS